MIPSTAGSQNRHGKPFFCGFHLPQLHMRPLMSLPCPGTSAHIFYISSFARGCAHTFGVKNSLKQRISCSSSPPRPVPPWTLDMHEPLILAFVLPFVSFFPWELRSTIPVLDLGRQVQRLWKDTQGDVGPLLWELCNLPVVMEGMSSSVVRDLLHPPRNG
jgi:hypothetical protein